MDVNTGAEKTNVKVEHLAAAMGPRVHKEPVPKNLLHLQDLLHQSKGRSVFEAVVAKDDADIYVNFTEMRQIIDSEKKPGVTSDESQPDRWKKLNRTLNVYDKMLGGNLDKLGYDKDGNADAAERILVTRVLADIPGFVESIAISTGGKMSIEQVRNCLTNGKNFPPEYRKLAGEMIGDFIGNPELRRRMEKALSTISDIIPKEDIALQNEIDALKVEVNKKTEYDRKKADYADSISQYDNLTGAERVLAQDYKSRIEDNLRGITEARYKPTVVNLGSVANKLSLIGSEISDLQNEAAVLQPAATNVQNRNATAAAEYNKVTNEIRKLKTTESLLKDLHEIYSDPNADKFIKIADAYSKAQEGLAEAETKLAEISSKERQIREKEAERNKYADKYKRKVERTLSEEMKRYWNEVKMEDAAEAAEAEAAEKKKLEAEAKTEAEKRAQKLEEMLNRYLRLSFMKYKGGKVTGWDDKAIKDFMHKDMLSQSPAQLARTFLEKIDDMSGAMPPQYQEEIAKMFKEMGVGKGDPPLTISKLLDGVDQKTYESFAAKKVPDMLGYAWARGYYFDRMKLKPHEAEFIKEAYKDPEFFKAAIAGRDEQIRLASELLQDNILSSGLTPELAKKIFGQDWTEGLNRLMKVLAVGAGAYVLGGGLSFGVGTTAQLELGANAFKDNLHAGADLAKAAVVTTSKLGSRALHGIVGNYAHAVAASAVTNGTPQGAQNMGGLLGKLTELEAPGGPLNVANNGPVTSP